MLWDAFWCILTPWESVYSWSVIDIKSIKIYNQGKWYEIHLFQCHMICIYRAKQTKNSPHFIKRSQFVDQNSGQNSKIRWWVLGPKLWTFSRPISKEVHNCGPFHNVFFVKKLWLLLISISKKVHNCGPSYNMFVHKFGPFNSVCDIFFNMDLFVTYFGPINWTSRNHKRKRSIYVDLPITYVGP